MVNPRKKESTSKSIRLAKVGESDQATNESLLLATMGLDEKPGLLHKEREPIF